MNPRAWWRQAAAAWAADPALVLACLLALFAVLQAYDLTRRGIGIDYYQQWLAIGATRIPGMTGVYREPDRDAAGRAAAEAAASPTASERFRAAVEKNAALYPHHLEATATPALPAWLSLLRRGDYDADLDRFGDLSLAAFLLGLLLLARAEGLPAAACALVLVVFTWPYHPFRADTGDGNVGRLQLGALGLYLWLLHRAPERGRGGERAAWLAGGFLLGLLTMFKPNLAPVPPLLAAGLALRRRWRELGWQGAGLLIGVAASVALPWWRFGRLMTWADWLTRARELQAQPYAVEAGNISLARLLLERTGLDFSLPLAGGLAAAAVAAMWAASRRVKRAAEPGAAASLDEGLRSFAVGTGAALALLAAQVAWTHYLLLVIPLILFSLRPGRRATGARVAVALATLACAQTPLAMVHLVNSAAGVAAWVAAALLALLAAAAWRLMNLEAPTLNEPRPPGGVRSSLLFWG